MSDDRHPKSAARECAFQFLYQSEIDRVLYFAKPRFEAFVAHFEVPAKTAQGALELARGVYDRIEEIDRLISKHLKGWTLERMPTTDRIIARVAVAEILVGETPHKVIINEAIELGKKYGTSDSGAFLNGILDGIVKRPSSD